MGRVGKAIHHATICDRHKYCMCHTNFSLCNLLLQRILEIGSALAERGGGWVGANSLAASGQVLGLAVEGPWLALVWPLLPSFP